MRQSATSRRRSSRNWSLLGQWPGARLVDEGGILRYETPLSRLPYNGVIRTRLPADCSDSIAAAADAYARRGAQFYWLVHPSSTPDDLDARLPTVGLSLVEKAFGMSLDLGAWEPSTPEPNSPVTFSQAKDEAGLRAYEDLIMSYWELGEEDRAEVVRLNRHWSGPKAKGHRWLAYVDGAPVGKGYLSLAGPPGVASIYGMSVLPEARGMGIASGLTRALIDQAQTLSCARIVLHSSAMARGLYRRTGFTEHCEFRFYATGPIWTGEH
jgi:ribosomal protein S18 acetylase RimI-like enzyme